uniref:putative hydroxypyruvate isomerase isoform X3 n=1 Tax=Maylandia zebra TaxID=106582 RepID=UPI0006487268|nr:putative hydroxypyruvate isomerase isoform X3 [Maylandia zebra]
MAPLKFCANISWLFTELPDFSQRILAAAAAGFQAVEAAWLYDSDLQELQRVRKATGVEVVLINTPPGDIKAGDLGLGAVPGREAEFREGLDLSVKYARALDCKRIHLMAGRVPVDSDRATVAKEMEAVFVQNLKYAADILSKEGITGLIEPINTRITDPGYFLDSPHQASAILEKDIFHWQIMDGNLTQNIQKYIPVIVLELVGVTAWWLELEPGNGHNAQKLDVQRELTYPADDMNLLWMCFAFKQQLQRKRGPSGRLLHQHQILTVGCRK